MLLLFGCSNLEETKTIQIQEGDILFQNLDCGDMCKAIEAVTAGHNNEDFSHCGLVVKYNDTLRVVEAIGTVVQLSTLHDFFDRSQDLKTIQNIRLGRLKKHLKINPNFLSEKAKDFVGQPYDQAFILNNGSMYCSELIYEISKKAHRNKAIFKLEPMTFKKPKSPNFFPIWIEYYQYLKRPIPEGELGLNPGSMSRSPNLDVYSLNLKTIKYQIE